MRGLEGLDVNSKEEAGSTFDIEPNTIPLTKEIFDAL